MPKVSIIIPIYNVEKYIERCVRSLMEQTLDDIEYIFIDDCSSDKSVEILNRVMEEYPNRKGQVVIHHMERNLGQSKVRIWGIQHATGDYVIHCDSDDIPSVHMYERMYNEAYLHNYDIVFCNFNFVSETNIVNIHQHPEPIILGDNKKLLEQMCCRRIHLNNLWAALVKRYLLSDIIYPEGHMGEDLLIMRQLVYKTNLYTYIDEPLYNYFVQSQSISHSSSAESCLKRSIEFKKNIDLYSIFVCNHIKEKHFEKLLIIDKLTAKLFLWPQIDNIECQKLWIQTYPEIDSKIMFCKYVSLKEKLYILSLKFHILPLWILIKKICRK